MSILFCTLIAGQPYGTGRGTTKKAAEQMAADLTLAMLGQRKANDVKGGPMANSGCLGRSTCS